MRQPVPSGKGEARLKSLGIVLTGGTEMIMIRQTFTRLCSILLLIGAIFPVDGLTETTDSDEKRRTESRTHTDNASGSSYSLREYKESGALRKDDSLERYMEQGRDKTADSIETLSNRQTGYERRDYGHKRGKSGTSDDFGSHRSYRGGRSPYGRDGRSPDGFGSGGKR